MKETGGTDGAPQHQPFDGTFLLLQLFFATLHSFLPFSVRNCVYHAL